MANKSIWLRRAWLLSDVLIIWMYLCYFYDCYAEDEQTALLVVLITWMSIFIAWIYFCIYPNFKNIFLKTFLVWLGYFLGFDACGGGVSHTFDWVKHVFFENHTFWLSADTYVLIVIIFIMMLFNWIFAQIILKVVSYFRGNIDKGDRLL